LSHRREDEATDEHGTPPGIGLVAEIAEVGRLQRYRAMACGSSRLSARSRYGRHP